MQSHEEMIVRSKEKGMIAKHILSNVYPMLKEPKLLISAIENTLLCMIYSLEAILLFAKDNQLIKRMPNTLTSKLILFDARLAKQLKIEKRFLKTIKEINDLIILHKSAPIEFNKNNSIVICTEDYSLSVITKEKADEYLACAALFQKQIEDSMNMQRVEMRKEI